MNAEQGQARPRLSCITILPQRCNGCSDPRSSHSLSCQSCSMPQNRNVYQRCQANHCYVDHCSPVAASPLTLTVTIYLLLVGRRSPCPAAAARGAPPEPASPLMRSLSPVLRAACLPKIHTGRAAPAGAGAGTGAGVQPQPITHIAPAPGSRLAPGSPPCSSPGKQAASGMAGRSARHGGGTDAAGVAVASLEPALTSARAATPAVPPQAPEHCAWDQLLQAAASQEAAARPSSDMSTCAAAACGRAGGHGPVSPAGTSTPHRRSSQMVAEAEQNLLQAVQRRITTNGAASPGAGAGPASPVGTPKYRRSSQTVLEAERNLLEAVHHRRLASGGGSSTQLCGTSGRWPGSPALSSPTRLIHSGSVVSGAGGRWTGPAVPTVPEVARPPAGSPSLAQMLDDGWQPCRTTAAPAGTNDAHGGAGGGSAAEGGAASSGASSTQQQQQARGTGSYSGVLFVSILEPSCCWQDLQAEKGPDQDLAGGSGSQQCSPTPDHADHFRVSAVHESCLEHVSGQGYAAVSGTAAAVPEAMSDRLVPVTLMASWSGPAGRHGAAATTPSLSTPSERGQEVVEQQPHWGGGARPLWLGSSGGRDFHCGTGPGGGSSRSQPLRKISLSTAPAGNTGSMKVRQRWCRRAVCCRGGAGVVAACSYLQWD